MTLTRAEALAAVIADPDTTLINPIELAVLDKTAPERIWLQIDSDGCADDRDEPFPDDHDGVTWCSENIGGIEVEYVRADLVAHFAAEPAEGWVMVPRTMLESIIQYANTDSGPLADGANYPWLNLRDLEKPSDNEAIDCLSMWSKALLAAAPTGGEG